MRNASDKKLGNVPLMVLGIVVLLLITMWLIWQIFR